MTACLAESTASNELLAAMPPDTMERWLPQLVPVELPLGHVVYEPGATLQYVYFPTTALVSLLHVLRDGAMAEIAVVGRDGVVGISLFMGGGSTSSRGVVQSCACRARRSCASSNSAAAPCTCCCGTRRR